MQIVTSRLLLRRFGVEDLESLATILLHPEVARWLGGGVAALADVARTLERYEQHWAERGYGRLAVCDRTTGVLVGRAGVMHEPRWIATTCKDEIGWTIAHDRWGQGLATEAADAALDDAFGRVRLRDVVSYTLPDNVASVRVMEKIGLERGGITVWAGTQHLWFSACAAQSEQPKTRLARITGE